MLLGASRWVPRESVMHDVAIDHITYVSMSVPNDYLYLKGPPAKDPDTPQMYNITWTNTIGDVGTYGMWPSGGTPEENCANFKERPQAAGSQLAGNRAACSKGMCWQEEPASTANIRIGRRATSPQAGWIR